MNFPVVPNPLSLHDRCALIAPASPVSCVQLNRAVSSLLFLGLEPVIFPSCLSSDSDYEYLSGNDELRALDINRAFSDPSIKAIFCVRGGYGTLRILDKLDYSLIARTPKFLTGYSDITALQNALIRFSNIAVLQGPVPAENYYTLTEHSLSSLQSCLFRPLKHIMLRNPADTNLTVIHPGYASAPVAGGNLTVLQSTLGTPFEVDTDEKILYLEDTGEPLYKLDRMMTSLKLSGKFAKLKGVMLGAFTSGSNIPQKNYEIKAVRLISSFFTDADIPVVSGWHMGHIHSPCTVPMGVEVVLDTNSDGLLLP